MLAVLFKSSGFLANEDLIYLALESFNFERT
jgi:hypothetical protein